MDWSPQAFDDDPELRALRDAYAASLPDRVRDLHDAWQAASGGDWDLDGAQAVLRQAHDLAGSAASYGFPTISMLARRIEQDLKQLPSLAERPPVGVVDGLAATVAELLDAGRSLTRPRPAVRPAPAPAPAVPAKAGGHVLIIDDDASVRSLLGALLRRNSFEVTACETGDDGLQQATQLTPDLILLDVSMPGMDGYEACYRLQNGRATYHIPIVFVTAHEDDQDKARAFAVGAADYLVKPVMEEGLLATVRRCLARNERWRDLQERAQAPVAVETRMAVDFTRFKDFLLERLQPEAAETARLSRMTWDALLETTAAAGIAGNDVATLTAEFCGLRFVTAIEPGKVRLGAFPASFCREHQVVALVGDGGKTDFVVANPFDLPLLEAIDRAFAGEPGDILIAEAATLQPLLEYRPQAPAAPAKPEAQRPSMDNLVEQLRQTYAPETLPLTVSDTGSERSAPIIQLVNQVIEAAHAQGASDIHIEPAEQDVVVRYRIDGQLRIANRLQPQRLILPLIARLKVMAGLDISERRLPQDGRIVMRQFVREAADVDLRLSTAPMNFGEKAVMRLIDKQKAVRPLEALGMSAHNLDRYRQRLSAPYGMILHVGPTGSGKSMTLYSALSQLATPVRNIHTAEDPIEYTLPGINQLQVRPDIGLTFARALRSFLRQDPDVILVGEIRDRETAETAIEAAMTGHLLLSTLHTNDAASTVARFLEMGIEPYMISSSLVMVCAQRLLRRLCLQCRQPQTLDARARQLLGLAEDEAATVYEAGPGCDACRGQGYAGRIGTHELLIPDDGLRALIGQEGVTAAAIKRAAVAGGMVTLYWDAMGKVRQGLCALDDVLTQVMPDEFDSRPDRS